MNKAMPLIFNRRSIYIILLAAILLRVIGINKSFQGDELFSVMSAADLGRIPSALIGDTHPPLFFYVLHFWMGICSSEFFLRLLNVICGMGLCLMAYVIGSQIAGEPVGLVSSAVIAVAPVAVWASQYIRTYAMAGFFVLVSVYFLIRLIESDRNEYYFWLGYVLASAASLYTFYFSMLMIIAENIYVILFMFNKKDFVIKWGLSQILIAAIFLPWLPFFIYQRASYTIHPPAIGLFIGNWHIGSVMRGFLGIVGLDPRVLSGKIYSQSAIIKVASFGASAILSLIFVFFIVRYYRSRKLEGARAKLVDLLLMLGIVPFLLATAINYFFGVIVIGHYFIANFVLIVVALTILLKDAVYDKSRAFLAAGVIGIYVLRLIMLLSDKGMDFLSARSYLQSIFPKHIAMISPPRSGFGVLVNHYLSGSARVYFFGESKTLPLTDPELLYVTHVAKLELQECDHKVKALLAKNHYSLIGLSSFGELVLEKYKKD